MAEEQGVVVIGAGGHAKVCIELLRAGGRKVAGVVGPDAAPVLGAPVLGGDDDLPHLHGEGLREAFVAVGDNARRVALGRAAQAAGFTLVNAVSPQAVVSPSATLGEGVAVMAGAVVNADARIGDFAVINTRASVDHDSVVEEGAHLAPGATLAGGVRVGAGALVGVNAAVIQAVSIGAGAFVGAGAAVVADVAAGATVIGVPARERA